MKIKINCKNCEREVFVDKKEINRGYGKFCSRKCSGEYNAAQRSKPKPNVVCATCGIEFYMNESKKRNSKSGLYFCCRKHKDEAQRIGGIKAIMPPHYGNGKNADYRSLAFATRPKKCERCGFDEHEAAIVVHHKDRNRRNNDGANLEVLCANCHYIEHWAEIKIARGHLAIASNAD